MIKKNSLNCIYPPVIAHRGAGKEAPENTMVALKYGLSQGFEMYECDVKLSADKKLFLLHDADLARTTNSMGLAKDKSWEELSQVDAGSWHSPLYKGEPLAHFDEVIDFILDNKVRLDVEVKPNALEGYETGRAVAKMLQRKITERLDQCVDLLFQEDHEQLFNRLYDDLLASPAIYCVKKQFLISSFDPESLRGAYEHVPRIPRALLVDDWSEGEKAVLDHLDALECAGIITNYKILTDDFIAKCHDSGRFVMVYTPNEFTDIKNLLNRGVDSVITDNMQAVQYVESQIGL